MEMIKMIENVAKARGLDADDLDNAVRAVALSRKGKVTEADGFEDNIKNVTVTLWNVAHDIVDELE